MNGLKSMRTLLAVKENKSLTKAAEELNEPKSTISRRIAILESELNTRLTCLSGRRLSLTKEGLCYADYCEQILQLEQAGREAVKSLKSKVSGNVSIGLSTELSRGWSTECLHNFTKQYPEINLEIQIIDCSTRVHYESIDIWISCCSSNNIQGVKSTKLGSWKQGIYAEKNNEQQISINELESLNWICSQQESEEIKFYNAGAEYKFKPQNKSVINSLFMRADAISQGFGIGILPCWIAECQKHGVHKYNRLFPELLTENIELWINYKVESESLIINTLRQWLKLNLPTRWK